MTIQEFEDQVATLIANLTAIKNCDLDPYAYEIRKSHYSLAACECAAQLGGFDPYMAKLFNRDYRETIINVFFDRAIKESKENKV